MSVVAALALVLSAAPSGQQWDLLSAYRGGGTVAPQSQTAEELYHRAYTLQKEEKDSLAAAHYAWALDLNPSLFPAHINLGNLLDSHGQLQEAAHHYRAAQRAQPRAQVSQNG
jgi:tetratricopeptide (TPR) repeat protein